MKHKETTQWIEKSEKRKQLLLNITQPITALQLSRKTGFTIDQCSTLLGQLLLCKLVKCLNPSATRSRLYWLTPTGIFCQKKLAKKEELPIILKQLPDIDWQLYGWICYNHRSAIIRALTEPMQPAAVKRRIRQTYPTIKMSANNVRDVMRLFLKKGIVRPVMLRKKAHPRYELTESGTKLQQLLLQSGRSI